MGASEARRSVRLFKGAWRSAMGPDLAVTEGMTLHVWVIAPWKGVEHSENLAS